MLDRGSNSSTCPNPNCGPDQVKIRVLRAGLCGTDLHLESWDDVGGEHRSARRW